jgi:prepilin-type N-terminal cleavage/methylation domain-containing protein
MKRAFTLIELLVVIAIIAILAAILFPVFAQAKMAAKKTASLSSIKQIGTAAQMYMGDADDNFVPYLWYNRGDGVFVTWMEMMHPYAKNAQIYINQATSTSKSTYTTGCGNEGTPNFPTVTSSYAYVGWTRYSYYSWNSKATMVAGFPITPNEYTTRAGGECDPAALAANPWRQCVAPANVANPSATAIFVPGYFVSYKRPTGPEQDTAFGSACTTGYAPDPASTSASTKAIQIFNDGGNYGMVDSSAKWYASKKMNYDNSSTASYGGGTVPASPYMKGKE